MKSGRFVFPILIFFCVQLVHSQEATKKPGFFVMHQNKVAMANVAKLNTYVDSVFAPVLNELVKEGKLLGWGQLDHSWGDEWNVNFYFLTENHRAFLDFWSEYNNRLNKRFPGWAAKIVPLLSEHKDNMYVIRTMQ